MEKNLNKGKFYDLEKNYGLIFVGLGIKTSVNGKTTTVKRPSSERELIYCVYFDKVRSKLYYVERDSMDMWHRLYEWPDKLIKDIREEYDRVFIKDMIRHKSSLLLAIRREDAKDIIVNLAGNRIASGRGIEKLTVFDKKLYHIDRRGLVNTEVDDVVVTNSHIKSLASLDKIYYGGYNGDIYSYDGVKSKKVCNVSFFRDHVSPVMELKSVEDSDGRKLYAGRLNENGILVVPLDNLQNHYTILRHSAFEVDSMALAPLKFIDKINKKGKWNKNK